MPYINTPTWELENRYRRSYLPTRDRHADGESQCGHQGETAGGDKLEIGTDGRALVML